MLMVSTLCVTAILLLQLLHRQPSLQSSPLARQMHDKSSHPSLHSQLKFWQPTPHVVHSLLAWRQEQVHEHLLPAHAQHNTLDNLGGICRMTSTARLPAWKRARICNGHLQITHACISPIIRFARGDGAHRSPSSAKFAARFFLRSPVSGRRCARAKHLAQHADASLCGAHERWRAARGRALCAPQFAHRQHRAAEERDRHAAYSRQRRCLVAHVPCCCAGAARTFGRREQCATLQPQRAVRVCRDDVPTPSSSALRT